MNNVHDPVPTAAFLRGLSFGAAAVSFAILLGVLQIGATDSDLKLAVVAAVAFMPLAIAAGVLSDFTGLARESVVRQWAAGRSYRLVDWLCAAAPLGPVVATGFLVHHLERRALIPYVISALAGYVLILYSAWRIARISDAQREAEAASKVAVPGNADASTDSSS